MNQGRTDGLRIAVVHSSVDQYSRADFVVCTADRGGRRNAVADAALDAESDHIIHDENDGTHG